MALKGYVPLNRAMWGGAPNENIVQNHLNIALLNIFYHLNGRYRHIFTPKNFSSIRISQKF